MTTRKALMRPFLLICYSTKTHLPLAAVSFFIIYRNAGVYPFSSVPNTVVSPQVFLTSITVFFLRTDIDHIVYLSLFFGTSQHTGHSFHFPPCECVRLFALQPLEVLLKMPVHYCAPLMGWRKQQKCRINFAHRPKRFPLRRIHR